MFTEFKCIVNKFALLKCCIVKPLEIITTTTDIYSFVVHQHEPMQVGSVPPAASAYQGGEHIVMLFLWG